VKDVRKLLRDPDKVVQLRAAQGLAPLGDKKAVSTLIALLNDLSLEQCAEVEDFLARIAGEKSPSTSVSSDKASREKAIEAWAKWWTDNRDKVVLTNIDCGGERELGLYLVVENYNNQTGRSTIKEIDKNGNVKRKMENGLSGAYDAQVLRDGRVLVIENQQRLTERDKPGKVVGLDKTYPAVFAAERLRNGDTFLACRNQLTIIDSKGNSKWTWQYNQNTIMAASILRNGDVAMVNYSGQYIRINRDKKEVKTFTVPNFSANGAAVAEGDRVIVSHGNMVAEYTSDGKDVKQVWKSEVFNYPLMPYRSPRGNTVFSSNSQTSVTELDSRGKTVRTIKLTGINPYRVTKR